MRLLGILLIVGFLSGCGSTPESQPEEASVTLVQMMRAQEADVKVLRQRIMDGDTLLNDLVLIHDFTEGEPSSPDKNDGNFPELSAAFVEAYNSLTVKPRKVDQFNNMITSCVDCHEQFCPGPIRQIKNLRIEQ